MDGLTFAGGPLDTGQKNFLGGTLVRDIHTNGRTHSFWRGGHRTRTYILTDGQTNINRMDGHVYK